MRGQIGASTRFQVSIVAQALTRTRTVDEPRAVSLPNDHMENKSLIKRGRKLIEEVASILERLPDAQVMDMLGTGALDQLLRAIFDPDIDKSKCANLQEFLLVNRGRSTLVALLRHVITRNYSFKGVTEDDGRSCFISPNHIQWFDDGVMFMQGDKRFEGLIGLYRQNGDLSYAVAARDTQKGEQMGPEHFEFIDSAEYSERLEQFPKSQLANLDQPIRELKTLLESKDNDESKYQELLINYPWVLGAKYRKIQRHTKLDDKTIPDFTGIRIRDDCRDIFEIKPPFTQFFLSGGEFSAKFYRAWSQAERYLDFARQEVGYLGRKRFRFENPKCYLILGFNLSIDEIGQIRTKERMNPAIELLTYNDLLVQMKWTTSFIRDLKDKGSDSCTELNE